MTGCLWNVYMQTGLPCVMNSRIGTLKEGPVTKNRNLSEMTIRAVVDTNGWSWLGYAWSKLIFLRLAALCPRRSDEPAIRAQTKFSRSLW